MKPRIFFIAAVLLGNRNGLVIAFGDVKYTYNCWRPVPANSRSKALPLIKH